MKLSAVLLICFLSLLPKHAIAQTIGDLIIGVGTIDLPIEDSSNLKSNIASFITSSATRAGILSNQYPSARFVTNVSAIQLDGDRIQISGIPMWVAEIQYDFSVIEMDSGNQFASYTLTVKQSGDSENDLMRQSVKELNSKRNAFISFMTQTKADILKYYTENMDRLLKNAELLQAQHDFDSAIRLLGQIPRECDGYDRVHSAIESAYTAKLDYECDSRMVQFNVLKGQKKYDEAIELLLELPNGSKCHSKAALLIEEVQNEVCTIYIQNAESNFSLGNTSGALNSLLGLEQLSPSCASRKNALESNIRQRLDETARLEWEQQQREYKDRIELVHKQMDLQHDLVSKAIQSEAQLRSKKMELEHQQALNAQEQDAKATNTTYVVSQAAEYVVLRSAAKQRSSSPRYINAYYSNIIRN